MKIKSLILLIAIACSTTSYGQWINNKTWDYNFGTTKAVFENKTELFTNSVSNVRKAGFLPLPNAAVSSVFIEPKGNGNSGHEAITSNGSTNVLIAKCVDEASQWHSFGTSHGSMNTVILKCIYPATTCFKSHASQPRNTLLDGVEGSLMKNCAGGAM
jgi:hypothetical protein